MEECLNPFAQTSNPCPVCNTPVEFTFIKPRLFVEQEKDIDLYPLSITWLTNEAPPGNPRHYFMQHCKQCGFTADHSFFKEPFKTSELPLGRFAAAFKEKSALHKEKFNLLEADANEDSLSRAIKLHLLAIYQFELFKDLKKFESLNLGRYYLRLAWLLRDGQPAPIEHLKETWDTPLDEKQALQQAVNYYENALNYSKALENQHEELRLLTLIARINLKLGQIKEAYPMLATGQDRLMKFEMQTKDLQREVAKTENHPRTQELAEMQADCRRMRKLLDDTRDIYAEHKRAWTQAELNRGRQILQQAAGRSRAEQEKLLQAQQLDEAIIQKLLPEKKKKGLFGLQFG